MATTAQRSESTKARPYGAIAARRSESTLARPWAKGAYAGALQFESDGLTPILCSFTLPNGKSITLPAYAGFCDNTVEILAESGEHWARGALRRIVREFGKTVKITGGFAPNNNK